MKLRCSPKDNARKGGFVGERKLTREQVLLKYFNQAATQVLMPDDYIIALWSAAPKGVRLHITQALYELDAAKPERKGKRP